MYERGIKGWLKHLDFILLDMLSLALAFFAAFSLRFSHAWSSYQPELYRELLIMLLMLDFGGRRLYIPPPAPPSSSYSSLRFKEHAHRDLHRALPLLLPLDKRRSVLP